jgi:hypothetical protein
VTTTATVASEQRELRLLRDRKSHRVLTPFPPLPLGAAKSGSCHLNKKIPPLHWDRRAIQPNHINYTVYLAALLRRCEIPLKSKCCTNSVGILCISVIYSEGKVHSVSIPHAVLGRTYLTFRYQMHPVYKDGLISRTCAHILEA